MTKKNSVSKLICKTGWIPLLTIVGLLILPVLVMTERTTDPALIIRHLIPSLVLAFIALLMMVSEERKQWAGRIIEAAKSPIAIVLFVFFALKLIGLSVAVNKVEVIFQASTSLLCFCIYILLSAMLAKHKTGVASWYLAAVIMLNVAILVFGVYGFYLVDFRLESMAEVGSQLVNQNLFAPMFLFSIPFIMLAQRRGDSPRLLWAFLVLDIGMILLLQNRATILALACGGSMFFGWKILNLPRIRQMSSAIKTSVLIVVGFGIFAGTFQVFKGSESFSVLLDSEKKPHPNFSSITERFMLWNRTTMLFSDNPVLGVGAGNWPLRIGEYGISDPGSDRGSKYFLRPHNELLRIISEHGALGLIPIMFLVLILVKWLKTTPNNLSKQIYLAALFGFLIISSFSFPTERIPLMMLLLLLLALSQNEQDENKLESRGPVFVPVVFTFITIILGSYFYSRMENDAIATKLDEARRAKNWSRVMRLSEKINQRILNVNYFSVPIHFYSGLSLYHQGNIEEAARDFTEALNHNPNHILTLTNLATCYSNLNQNEKAISTYKRALMVNPNFEKANLNLAIAYYQNRQFEDAYRQLQHCKNAPDQLRIALESAFRR